MAKETRQCVLNDSLHEPDLFALTTYPVNRSAPTQVFDKKSSKQGRGLDIKIAFGFWLSTIIYTLLHQILKNHPDRLLHPR